MVSPAPGKERDVETVGLCLPCLPTNSPPSPGEDRKKTRSNQCIVTTLITNHSLTNQRTLSERLYEI